MAFAYENRVLTTLGYRDSSDNAAVSSLYHVAEDDLTAVLDDMNLLGTAVAAVTDAQVASANVSRYARQTEGAPPLESDVRRKLFLEFETADRLDNPTLEIPSPIASIEQVGTNAVDPANPLVAAIVAAVANPLGTGSFVSRQGRPLLRLRRAYIGTRTRQQP